MYSSSLKSICLRSLTRSLWYLMCVCVSRSVMADSATPRTAAHQPSLSLRFSRQGYYSGLPFPSPHNLIPFVKSTCCLVAQSCPTLHYPMDCSPRTRLLCPWDFPRQGSWSGSPFHSKKDLPDPGIEPASLCLAGRFFTTEPPERHLNPLIATLSFLNNLIFA